MTEIIIARDAPVLVAIDVAKARHEVLIAISDKKRRRRLTILNGLADFNRLIATLRDYGCPVRVAFEATGNYHRALAYHLATAGFEVKLVLKIFGVRLPRTVKHGSFDGLVRPMIEMDDVLAHAVIPLLDARVVLFQHYLELDRRVKRAASQDEVCMRMMTVPGVGPIAALTFKAAVDDPSRFRRSRTVAAHFGLTPRRFQSGEHDNPGRISKAGDRDVRATLYAAANALLMRTMAGSQIKSWGMRLMRTKGRRRAVVAVARKLAVLLHRMWIDGSEFRQEQVGGTG